MQKLEILGPVRIKKLVGASTTTWMWVDQYQYFRGGELCFIIEYPPYWR